MLLSIDEFVGFETLSFVFGLSVRTLTVLSQNDFFDNVRQISTGIRRIRTKYHFGDCVRRIAPTLTDYDVARLRIEINEKLINKRRGRGSNAKKSIQGETTRSGKL